MSLTPNLKALFYDSGPKYADRYTVIYLDDYCDRQALYGARGMSEDPTHPQGVGMYCYAEPGEHLGKEIQFHELPEKCQQLVKQDLEVIS